MPAPPKRARLAAAAGSGLPASVLAAPAFSAWQPEGDCQNPCSLLPPPFRLFHNFLNPLNCLDAGLSLCRLCLFPGLPLLLPANLRFRLGEALVLLLVRGQGNPGITVFTNEENRAEVQGVIGQSVGISNIQAVHVLRNIG